MTSAILEIYVQAWRLAILVSRYLGVSVPWVIPLEMCVQALRLATLISVSRYLHGLSHLGDMVSSFEARILERASRSNAKTGL